MSKAFTAIRWTISAAASEFGCDDKTLSSRIRRESIEPGEDGKFSTAQICAALFGDIGQHRLRKMKAEADFAELVAMKKAGTLVYRDDFDNAYKDTIARGVKAISCLKSLTDAQKGEVFSAIRAARVPTLSE